MKASKARGMRRVAHIIVRVEVYANDEGAIQVRPTYVQREPPPVKTVPTEPPSAPRKCPFCDFLAATPAGLETHAGNVHAKAIYVCPECWPVVSYAKSPQGLAAHRRFVHGVKGKGSK